MYLILIAWFYVALMMAVAEATSPIGSVLGAVMTFLLYGALPMAIVGYIFGTSARRRAIKRREATHHEQHAAINTLSAAPDTDREAPRHTLSSVRKKP